MQCVFEFSVKCFLILISVLLLKDVDVNKLWSTADSKGWRASSAPRSYWPRTFVSVISLLLANDDNMDTPKCNLCTCSSTN
jgi:hypothetical protein